MVVEPLALYEIDFTNKIVSVKVEAIARRVLTTTWYSDMDEVEERELLRQKLMAEVNASGLLGEGSVTGVYFMQFILQ